MVVNKKFLGQLNIRLAAVLGLINWEVIYKLSCNVIRCHKRNAKYSILKELECI